MKVTISEIDNTTYFTVGYGKHSQDTAFHIGQLYQKVSRNVYFNQGEILECVDIIDNIAYFTCERLKPIHEKRFFNKEEITKGIPLRKDEEIILLTDNDLKLKELKEILSSSTKSLKNIQNSVKDTQFRIKQLEKNKKDLLDLEQRKKQHIKELKEQIENLK
tara:strand:+ start:342 stop:827 length:486 start_codon:yes stop_codon:yes gene_type:complete